MRLTTKPVLAGSRRCALLGSVLGLLCLVGCDGSATYRAEGPLALAGQVSPKAEWKATGTLVDLPKAFDGDLSTAAIARTRSSNEITIDLGRVCMFNLVAIHHGDREHAHCRRLAILVSLDGKEYKFCASGPGKRKVTNIFLGKYVLARYLRIQALIPGDEPWAVAEVYLQ